MTFFLKRVKQIFEDRIITTRRVARNSQWGRGCFGGMRAEPPALENFAFLCKNNLILGLF